MLQLISALVLLVVITSACEKEEDSVDKKPIELPGLVSLLSPGQLATNMSVLPTMIWSSKNGVNDFGEPIVPSKFRIYLNEATDLGEGEFPDSLVKELDDRINIFEVVSNLKPNTRYKWAVIAEASAPGTIYLSRSDIHEFKTGNDSSNQNPTDIELITPEHNSLEIRIDSTLFSWSKSQDPEGFQVKYYLTLNSLDKSIQKVWSLLDEDTFLDMELPDSTRFEWQVYATDPYGGATLSQRYQFKTPINSAVGQSISGQIEVLTSSARAGTEQEWGAIYGHKMVVYNGILYDAGGKAQENGIWRDGNDVYSSSDGTQWAQVRESQHMLEYPRGFLRSESLTMISYEDYMYAFNSISNRVLRSNDGEHWQLLPVDPSDDGYQGRSFHSAVAFNGAFYVIGGISNSGGLLGDVWVSYDEAYSWEKIVDNTNQLWRPGKLHAAVVNNNIYLIESESTNQIPSRIYRSSNGSDWDHISNAPWSSPSDFIISEYKQGIVVISGNSDNEIWWSQNGEIWHEVILNNSNSFRWRQKHDLVEFQGALLVSYGYAATTSEPRNDIVKITF